MDKILRQFLEVASFKNVSHAAKKLCLNQSTLSLNIQKLEQSLGMELFTRSSTGVELTECGEVLAEHIRMMQRIYDNALIKMEFIKERHDRELRVGTGHAWWYLFLRETVETYRERHPTANIHSELGNHLRLMDLLLSGDIDLFIGHEIAGLSRKAGVMFLPLFTTSNKNFVRQEHPLIYRECSLDDLLEYPHLEITPDESRYQHVMEDLQPKKLERSVLHLTEKIIYSSNSLMASIDMLSTTNAVMPYPGPMENYFRQFNLVPLTMTEPSATCAVGVYLLRERNDDPHIHDVLALMRHYLTANRQLLE